jgi:hypothetical protein
MTEHKNIYAALAAAQMQMGKALKDVRNDHFKSKYADLSNVMDACLPALNANGIAVYQPTIDEDGQRYVKTVLAHVTGETLECRVPLIVNKNDMQGYGSAVTYARRYGLMGMAGIAPEDDDGNAAAKAPPPVEQPRPRGPSDADIAHDRAVTDALVAIEGCHDRDTLTDLWKGLAPAVKSDPRAKNASMARAELFRSGAAKPAAPIIADEIPH